MTSRALGLGALLAVAAWVALPGAVSQASTDVSDQVTAARRDGDLPRALVGVPPGPVPVPPSPGRGTDINLIGTSGQGTGNFQSETTVDIDPSSSRLVVGFNDFRGFSTSSSISGYAFSTDGGISWTDGGQVPGSGPSGSIPWGDPDVKYHGGYWYYHSLFTNSSATVCRTCLHRGTFSGGSITWTLISYPVSSTTYFPDKPFITVDRTGGSHDGNIYMSYTRFNGCPYSSYNGIYFLRSTDGGFTWSSEVNITTSSGQGSIPRVAPNGDVYVAWYTSTAIRFRASSDQGSSWGTNRTVGSVSTVTTPPGSDRMNSFPSMDVTPAGFARAGEIHVVWASNVSGDGADIVYARSTNAGVSWSSPVTLGNTGSNRHQFFPWVSVDPTTGWVYVFWYDQRHATAGNSDLTDVYYVWSVDGGQSWLPTGTTGARRLTDASFDAAAGDDGGAPNIGDYNQCVGYGGNLYGVWADTRRGDPDVWFDYSLIPVDLVRFAGVGGPGFADLGWQTASESDNLGFYLLRKTAGAEAFARVNDALIEGAGTSADPRDYSYRDEPLGQGVYFYKLVDVSYSGDAGEHGPIEVLVSAPIPETYAVSVESERPITFLLSLPGTERIVLSLYNVAGREIRTLVDSRLQAGTHRLTWDGAGDSGVRMPEGTYVYRVACENYVFSGRVILTR
jgi:hypothetical protein